MYYIGLDIGGTKCASILGEEKNRKMIVVEKNIFSTEGKSPFEVLNRFCQYIDRYTRMYKIEGLGISCGGPLDSKKGIILSPPNLPNWDNIEIISFFENKFGIKTYLHNDANACAVAEWKFGAGKGYKNIIFLTFGTGLGAGIILNSKLYVGTNDMAGEVGHIRIDKTGPEGYGKQGSFEGFCSGGGIAKLGRIKVQKLLEKGVTPELYIKADFDMDKINAKLIADLADNGDIFCKKIYAECGKKLGCGLSIIIDILNPEVIIIGSIFARSENLLREYAEKEIKKEALLHNAQVCKIVPVMLGESIGDIAALSIAAGRV